MVINDSLYGPFKLKHTHTEADLKKRVAFLAESIFLKEKKKSC